MSSAGLPRIKPRAVAIVWKANGRPAIEDEWVKGLTPYERDMVERALAARGFRLNGFQVEELDNGNSLDGRS